MCELLCERYNGRHGCGHTVARDYQRCSAAFRRSNRQLCLPPGGRLRDLDRVVDIENDYLDGPCPVCRGETPPSSEGSELMFIV